MLIALFSISNPESKLETVINNYWVFNPYLTFNGNAINKRVLDLFADTNYAKLIKI